MQWLLLSFWSTSLRNTSISQSWSTVRNMRTTRITEGRCSSNLTSRPSNLLMIQRRSLVWRGWSTKTEYKSTFSTGIHWLQKSISPRFQRCIWTSTTSVLTKASLKTCVLTVMGNTWCKSLKNSLAHLNTNHNVRTLRWRFKSAMIRSNLIPTCSMA
jgi:hypothetical protein